LWLQKLPSNQVLKRGYEDKLIIEDTSYDHQGEYVCEAVNVIGDQKKIVQSEPIKMEVRGTLILMKADTVATKHTILSHSAFSFWIDLWREFLTCKGKVGKIAEKLKYKCARPAVYEETTMRNWLKNSSNAIMQFGGFCFG
jgi:hypothetical protein